jgi:hypothetical protein
VTDAELLKASTEFRDGLLDCTQFGGDPTGMCFAVSSALGGYLSMLGLDCRLAEDDFGFTNHVWLVLPDGRVLDATADQFNRRLRCKLPKVYLGPMPRIYRRWQSRSGGG